MSKQVEQLDRVIIGFAGDCGDYAAHADDPSQAFALSRLTDPGRELHRAPVGIFRQVQRPTYDDLARQQLRTAREESGEGDLAALLAGSDAWTV